MKYNTQRDRLMISEYGRYIQNMARAIAKIEDKEKRNAMARAVIELMSQANPQFKNIEEYKHKLWDHLIMVSDFKLVVDSPYPFPDRRDLAVKGTKPLPYPGNKIRMRHYGKNVERLADKAKATDESKRKGMAEIVAYYMKLCYANWGKDNVSDDSIRTDLEMLSKGMLELDKDYTFSEITPSRQHEQVTRKNHGKNRNHKRNRNFKNNFRKRNR